MAAASLSSKSSARSNSSTSSKPTRGESDDDRRVLEAELDEMYKLNLGDDDRDGKKSGDRASKRSSNAGSEKLRSPAESSAAVNSNRRKTNGIQDSPAHSGDSESHAESPKKIVGFSRRADFIDYQDNSERNDDQSFLVTRSKEFALHSQGDMLADGKPGTDNKDDDSQDGADEERTPRVSSAQLRQNEQQSQGDDGWTGEELDPNNQEPAGQKRTLSAQERKKRKEEREKEEKQRKAELNKEIFEAWKAEKERQKARERSEMQEREERKQRLEKQKLEKQRRLEEEEKAKRREERLEKLRARREKAEAERQRYEDNDAVRSWLDQKKKQLERDRQLMEELRKEEMEMRGIRSPSEERKHQEESERAFREWKRRKDEETARKRETAEENNRLTRLILKHVQRSQQLASAMQSNTSTGYTDYYGYRY